MSFLRILPAFALIACGSAEKEDDTSAFEPTSEPTSEPASAPTSDPGPTTFAVDFMTAYGMANVANSTEISGSVTVNGENGPFELDSTFFIILAYANWSGEISDGNNACILQYSLENGTVDDDFFTEVSTGWVGWNFSGETNLTAESAGCASLADDFKFLYEGFKTADFGFGMAPMSTEFSTALRGQEGTANHISEADWNADYAPYFYSHYIKLNSEGFQGGSSGWSEISYAFAYEVGEDGALTETTNDAGETINVRLDISGATFAPDGFHFGSYAGGWSFGQ